METIPDIGHVLLTEETLLISDRLCTTKGTCFHEEDIDCIEEDEEEVEIGDREHHNNHVQSIWRKNSSIMAI